MPKYLFSIALDARGNDPEDAWENAVAGFIADPGACPGPEDFILLADDEDEDCAPCECCGDATEQVINAHAVCERCDHEFCFQCGAHPVDLLGDHAVCEDCFQKPEFSSCADGEPGR